MKPINIPDPRNAAQALYLARIQERAENLFTTGGYTYKSGLDMFPDLSIMAGMWLITSPEKKHYVIDGLRGTCDCPHFKDNGYCKHYIAMQIESAPFDKFDEEVARLREIFTDELNPLIPSC